MIRRISHLVSFLILCVLALNFGCDKIAGYSRSTRKVDSGNVLDQIVIDQGHLGENCYPNQTCNLSLVCIEGRCIKELSKSDSGADSQAIDTIDAAPSDLNIEYQNCLTPLPKGTNGQVSKLIGQDYAGSNDGKIETATLFSPTGIAQLSESILLIADRGSHRIRAYGCGEVWTFSGRAEGYLNGHISDARFSSPSSICVTRDYGIFIADSGNHLIRQIKDNIVTRFAGSAAGSGDGYLTHARFNSPRGLVYDELNQILFVSDFKNGSIRRIDIVNSRVDTLADGLLGPTGMLLISTNQLLVSETDGHRITLIDLSTSTKTSYAGTGVIGYVDGNADSAQFHSPVGLTQLSDSSIVVADSGNHMLRAIKEDEVWSLAGSNTESGITNGSFSDSLFMVPYDLFSINDTIYISDIQSHQLRLLLR